MHEKEKTWSPPCTVGRKLATDSGDSESVPSAGGLRHIQVQVSDFLRFRGRLISPSSTHHELSSKAFRIRDFFLSCTDEF